MTAPVTTRIISHFTIRIANTCQMFCARSFDLGTRDKLAEIHYLSMYPESSTKAQTGQVAPSHPHTQPNRMGDVRNRAHDARPTEEKTKQDSCIAARMLIAHRDCD